MRSHSLRVIGLLALAWPLGQASCLRAETATWDEPDIDSFVYVNAFGGGTRLNMPSFANLVINESNDGFTPNLAPGDPSRLATSLMAFETSGSIEAGLEANRYRINSVSVTITSQSGTNGVLLYRNTPITPDELVAQATGAGITPELPIELFGVGFRSGVDGFALGPDQTGNRFDESTSPFANGPASSVFPVIGDGTGGLIDVSNNLTGGLSATSASGETDPFVASPWAIGATPGLQAGETVADNTTFTFDLDLGQPGLLAYLQGSLSEGALGFFVSSIHPAAQPGPGSTGFVYPQWYTKEGASLFPEGQAPTLEIDFAVLPLPGDYDNNGVVESADYDEWSAAYGDTVAEAGTGADGNADGVVNAADYTVWRDALTATASLGAASVPEPSSAVYALAAIATASFCLGQIALTSPRGRKE